VTDLDAPDLVPVRPGRRPKVRWKAVVTLAGIAGLAFAAYATVGDADDVDLPGIWPLLGALILHLVALWFAGQGWVALFPRDADRASLTSGLYLSQLTKYLPAGGFVQAASQVALSSDGGGVATAALRLPVFLGCLVVASLTLGATVAFNVELTAYARVLAGLCVLSVVLLDRRIFAWVLRAGRRWVTRLPDPANLPPQRAILRCYAFCLGNIAAYAVAFVILLDGTSDVRPVLAASALALGWAAGFLVAFAPSGLVVREAVILAALPTLAAAPLLAASVAHRLVGLVAEAMMAGTTRLRAAVRRRRSAVVGPTPAGQDAGHAPSLKST
jgi:glycosyltransferase 2 family protein